MASLKDSGYFNYTALSDTGLLCSQNKDEFAYFESINGHVFIVCDGQGGCNDKPAASKRAVDCIRAYLENHYFDMPEDALKAAIEYANAIVFKNSKEISAFGGMSTTIVMMIVRYEKVYYAHVGNSRIYIFSNGELSCLTQDHYLVVFPSEQTDKESSDSRNERKPAYFPRTLGSGPNIDITICSSPAFPARGDFILMCTDGITSKLEDNEIVSVLADSAVPEEKAKRLIQLANSKGGTDNMTVMLVDFYNVSNRKSRFVKATQQTTAEIPLVKSPILKTPDLFEQEIIVDNGEQNEVEEISPQKIVSNEISAKEAEPLTPDEETSVSVKDINTEPEPQTYQETKVFQEIKAEPLFEESPEPQENNKIPDDSESNAGSFFSRLFNRLNVIGKNRPRLKVVLIVLGAVLLAYIVWDLFIKQGATSKISNKPDTMLNDTSEPSRKSPENDKIAEEKSTAPDTIWISYSVKKGDFLGTIAAKFGLTVDYIKKKNKLTNDNIREKQKLDIPTKANYQVKAGETFDMIGKRFQVDKKRIMKANDISDEKNIREGRNIIIPFK
ncbi:MAG: LysM peptidoglycan-binding domain-containing protein [Bacteroidales bacterium]|jgi:serine/threonine protein phosphatase PrpC|nr:LysM peptidoglycan-binding domain-containing protein [Bacteroidales bacterium]MDD4214348.1 LysM peptidoglycan-binding domain-containing protein [Bacteroidales bacterium]